MVDEEASVMTMAMISFESSSRQSARTEFLVPELGFLVAAAKRNSFWKNVEPPFSFRSRGFIWSRGEVEGELEAATPPLGAA